MKLLKISLLFVLLTLSLFLGVDKVYAAEGTTELRSTNNQSYRCFAASLLMENSRYKIIVSCRDLIYPPQPDLFNYVIWATPIEGKRAIKLGELGVGKANFEIKDAFSNLFVTTEKDKNTKIPKGDIVMKGNTQSISFLDKPTSPTPTPEKDTEEESATDQDQKDEVEIPTQELTTRDRLVEALKRAGVVVLFGLVALVGLIFVLTRPK